MVEGVGVFLLFVTVQIAVGQTSKLFVSDSQGYVYSITEDGYVNTFSVGSGSVGLAIDPLMGDSSADFVYSAGTAYRQQIYGSTPTNVFSPSDYGGNATRLAVDPTSSNIFYVSMPEFGLPYRLCNISVVTPDGADHATLLVGLEELRDIAIHPELGLLFYSAEGQLPHIGVAYMDGSGRYPIVDTDIISPNGVAIDYNNNVLYWTDAGKQTIESCQFDGTNRIHVVSSPNIQNVYLMDIVIDGDYLFYNNFDNTLIQKVQLSDVSNQTTFIDISTASGLGAMAVYSDNLVQRIGRAHTGCSWRKGLGDCSNLCLPGLAGAVCKCHDGVQLQFNQRTCENAVLCSGTIPDVSLSTACNRHKYEVCDFNCNYPLITPFSHLECMNGHWNVSHPCSVPTSTGTQTGSSTTVPYTGTTGTGFRLYVTNSQSYKIYSVDEYGAVHATIDTYEPPLGIAVDRFAPDSSFVPSFVYSTFAYGSAHLYRQYIGDGSGPSYLFTEYGVVMERLAIDPTSGNIFYIVSDPATDLYSQNSSIYVSFLYGRRKLVIPGLYQPKDIALHASEGRLFWSDLWSDVGSAVISTANMDGTNVRHIITDGIISPNGLAIDYNGNMLYWTDADLHQIESCSFDGQLRTIVMSLPDIMLMDILLDGNFIYYTNQNNSDITRLDIFNTANQETFTVIADTDGLDALAVYSYDYRPVNVFCSNRNGLGDCSDLCLPNSRDRTCACTDGGNLDESGRTCDNAPLCSSAFPAGNLSSSCSRHIYEVCDIMCENAVEALQVKCDEAGVWNNTDPCSGSSSVGNRDFRLYVVSPEESRIYAFDEIGAITNTYDTSSPAGGIAVDLFRSSYTITPMAPSFVYSVSADFYRQYMTSMTPEYMFTSPVSGATVVQFVIDQTSGNIFYIGLVPGNTLSGFIAVVTPSLDHVTLISSLSEPTDIVSDTEQGLLFWSDVGKFLISSAYMDGSGETAIVASVAAYSLAIDNQGKVLYWADRNSYSIESCDYFGLRGSSLIETPGDFIKDLTIDGGILFYTTQNFSDIYKVELYGIHSHFIYVPGITSLGSVTAKSSESSIVVENMYCQNRDGRGDCSNVCLPNIMGRSCRCDDSTAMDYNGRTCTNAEVCPSSIPHVSLDTLCDRHKYDVCTFSCNHPYMSPFSQIRCEGTYWNDTEPCTESTTGGSTTAYPYSNSGFRLYVTNSENFTIYSLDENGNILHAYDISEPPFGIAVDKFTRGSSAFLPSFVYSTNPYNDGNFYRQYFGGSGSSYLFTEFGKKSERFAIDPTSGNIFYISSDPSGDPYIKNSNISVSSPHGRHTSIVGGLYQPKDIVLDAGLGWLFWCDLWSDISSAVISRADMDGTNVIHIITENIISPVGITIDYYGSLLYWADADLHQIESCDFDGGHRTILISVSSVMLMDILVDGDFIYFTNGDNSEITRVDRFDIANLETFATIPNTRSLDALAVYSYNSVPTNGYCSDRNGLGDCSDLCLPSSTHHTCACTDGGNLDASGRTCDNAPLCSAAFPSGTLSPDCKHHIYEVCDIACDDSGEVLQIKCEDTGFWNNTDPCAGSPSGNPSFLLYVISPDDNRIYAVDEIGSLSNTFDIADISAPSGDIAIDYFQSSYTITPTVPSFIYSVSADFYRQYTSGTSFENVHPSPVSGATVVQFVIDRTSGNIFYIGVLTGSPSSGFIAVMTPSFDHVTLKSALNEPTDIALFIEDGLLFWSQTGDFSINSANMDGSGQATIMTGVSPNSLAVDTQGRILYWADINTFSIECCDFNGVRGDQLIALPSTVIGHILIDGRFLYYTTPTSSDLFKVELDGSHIQSFFTYIPGTSSLGSMAVYSASSAALPKNMYCQNRDGRGDCSNLCLPNMMGRSCRCDDSVALDFNGRTCENAELCPANIPHVSLGTLCDRHRYDVCDFYCDYPYTSPLSQLRCEGTHWNVSEPCTEPTTGSTTDSLYQSSPSYEVINPDFRLLVTDTVGQQIHLFNQLGGTPVNSYYDPVLVRGIAVDHFMSQYLSGPVTPSFVYSVDGPSGAEFYRQYFDESSSEYIFSCPVYEAIVERLTIDLTSGNIIYIGVVPDSSYSGFIGVITRSLDHVTVLSGLSEPTAIALLPDQGKVYWSEIGLQAIRFSFMDGSETSNLTTGVISYGLAIDYTAYILYWTDGYSESIQSCDLNTMVFSTVKTFYHLVLNDILVDGQFLYYTNFNTSEIAKINKDVIEDESVAGYVPGAIGLNAVAVYSWDSSAAFKNPSCQERDGLGDCSNVCLPNSETTHICLCDDAGMIQADGKTCENAVLCPNSVPHGYFYGQCNFHRLEVCTVKCDDGILTADIQCQGPQWNELYPCSDTTTTSSPYHSEETSPNFSGSGPLYPTGQTFTTHGGSFSGNPTGPTMPGFSGTGTGYSTGTIVSSFSRTSTGYPTGPTIPGFIGTGTGYPTGPTMPGFSGTGTGYPTEPTIPGFSSTGSGFPSGPTMPGFSGTGTGYQRQPTTPGFSGTGTGYPTGATIPGFSSTGSGYPTGHTMPGFSSTGTGYPTAPTMPGFSGTGTGYPTAPTMPGFTSTGTGYPTGTTLSHFSSTGTGYPTGPTMPGFSRTGTGYPTGHTMPGFSSTGNPAGSSMPSFSGTGTGYPTGPTMPGFSGTGTGYPTGPTMPFFTTTGTGYQTGPTMPGFSGTGTEYPTGPTMPGFSGTGTGSQTGPTMPGFSGTGTGYPTGPTMPGFSGTGTGSQTGPTMPGFSGTGTGYPTGPTMPGFSSTGTQYPTGPTMPGFSGTGTGYPTEPTMPGFTSTGYTTGPTMPGFSGTGTGYPTGPTMPSFSSTGTQYQTGPTMPGFSRTGTGYPTGPTMPGFSGTGTGYPTGPTMPGFSSTGTGFPTGPTMPGFSGTGTGYPTEPTMPAFTSAGYTTGPTMSGFSGTGTGYPTGPTMPGFSSTGTEYPTGPTMPGFSGTGTGYPTGPTMPGFSGTGTGYPTGPTMPGFSSTGTGFPTGPSMPGFSSSGITDPTGPTMPGYSSTGTEYPSGPTMPGFSGTGTGYPTGPTMPGFSSTGTEYPTGPTMPGLSSTGTEYPTGPTMPGFSGTGTGYPTGPTMPGFSSTGTGYTTGPSMPGFSSSGITHPTGPTMPGYSSTGTEYPSGPTMPGFSGTGTEYPTGATMPGFSISGTEYPTGPTMPGFSSTGTQYPTGPTMPGFSGTATGYPSQPTTPGFSGTETGYPPGHTTGQTLSPSGSSNPTGQVFPTATGSGSAATTGSAGSSATAGSSQLVSSGASITAGSSVPVSTSSTATQGQTLPASGATASASGLPSVPVSADATATPGSATPVSNGGSATSTTSQGPASSVGSATGSASAVPSLSNSPGSATPVSTGATAVTTQGPAASTSRAATNLAGAGTTTTLQTSTSGAGAILTKSIFMIDILVSVILVLLSKW